MGAVATPGTDSEQMLGDASAAPAMTPGENFLNFFPRTA